MYFNVQLAIHIHVFSNICTTKTNGGELSKEKLDCAESERRRGCCLEYHCPTQKSSCAQISLHTSSTVYSNALHRNSDMQCTVHLFCMSAMLGNFWTKIPQSGNVYTAMCRDVVLCQLVGKSDHSRLRMSPMVPQGGGLFSDQTKRTFLRPSSNRA